jgi:hypothetical protein
VENRVLGGFLLSLLNPSFPLWWIAVGLSLTAKVTPTVGNVSAFYAGHISSDFAWYVFVSLVVGLGRRHIPDKAYRTVLVVLALMLIVYACIFGLAAVTGVRPPEEAGAAAGDPVGEAQARPSVGDTKPLFITTFVVASALAKSGIVSPISQVVLCPLSPYLPISDRHRESGDESGGTFVDRYPRRA